MDNKSDLLVTMLERLTRDVDALKSVVESLSEKEFDRIKLSRRNAKGIKRRKTGARLVATIGLMADRLMANGHFRTAEGYRSAARSFERFLKASNISAIQCEPDLALSELTAEVMEAYEAWHRGSGNSLNTSSYYLRIFRAVYNRALDDGLVSEDKRPFRRVFVGVAKTPKRALTIDNLRSLKRLNLPEGSSLVFARDMFLLSFYLRGMSFIDMAYLQKSDLTDGRLAYRRRKTGQRLEIEWTPEMQQIVDRYPDYNNQFLLPIIRSTSVDAWKRDYHNCSYRINYNLKRLATLAGIKQPLTMYVARHSWASVAKMSGVPIAVISEGMGHESESTTKIYLAQFERKIVDDANRQIMKSL